MSDFYGYEITEDGKVFSVSHNWRGAIDLSDTEYNFCEDITVLKEEIYLLREALAKIANSGGVCSDDSCCPVCIAEKALKR